MYKEVVKELKKEKKEALISILKDYYLLYIKIKIGYPNLLYENNTIQLLINHYIECDNNEKEVLNEITKSFGKLEYNETIEQLLYEFDEIFKNYYLYIDSILSNYEEILNKDIIETIINRITGKYKKINIIKYKLKSTNEILTFNNKYKEKVLKQIRSI